MVFDLSELLAARLGMDRAGNDTALPDSLAELKSSIDKMRQKSERDSEKTRSEQETRAQELSIAYNQFSAELKEVAKTLAALNKTEGDSLKAAEKKAKAGESRRRTEDAVAKRSAESSKVFNNLNAQKSAAGLKLLGAFTSRGFAEVVGGFLKAKADTKSDISDLNQARYSQALGDISDTKDARMQAADDRIAEANARLEDAQKTYSQRQAAAAEAKGRGIVEASAASKTLDTAAAAEANYNRAVAERDKVSRESLSRVEEVKSSGPSKGNAPALSPAIAESTGRAVADNAPAGLILDDATLEALRAEKVKQAQESATSAVDAAEAKVTTARDAYASMLPEKEAAEAQFASGEAAIRAASADLIAAKDALNATVAQNKKEMSDAVEEKAAAINQAEASTQVAYDKANAGGYVSESEASSIGMTNMALAAANPAATVIATSLEEFMKLFPVIRQAGGALVELSAALPAITMTIGMKTGTAILKIATAVKEVFDQSDVSKRYDEEETARIKAGKATGGELYSRRVWANVDAYKANAAPATGEIEEYAGRIVTAAPAEAYTLESPASSASAGVSGSAPSREAPRAAQAPSPKKESSIGVFPMGPSNANIDSWR